MHLHLLRSEENCLQVWETRHRRTCELLMMRSQHSHCWLFRLFVFSLAMNSSIGQSFGYHLSKCSDSFQLVAQRNLSCLHQLLNQKIVLNFHQTPRFQCLAPVTLSSTDTTLLAYFWRSRIREIPFKIWLEASLWIRRKWCCMPLLHHLYLVPRSREKNLGCFSSIVVLKVLLRQAKRCIRAVCVTLDSYSLFVTVDSSQLQRLWGQVQERQKSLCHPCYRQLSCNSDPSLYSEKLA